MSNEVSIWVEMAAFLNQRKDELSAAVRHEGNGQEKLRLEGALRELNWLIEQVQEQWGTWASGQPGREK